VTAAHALWIVAAFHALVPATPSPSPPAGAGPAITVSKETTYFLGPLKPDGTVDYAAALNHLSAEGVSPANNAAVLLLPAFGAALLGDRADAAEVPARIGARPLTPTGEAFVTMRDYAQGLANADAGGASVSLADMLRDTVRDAPWSEAEHPLAAGWLRANERALERMVEASARERYWLPLREGEPLWKQAPNLVLKREAAAALSSRAMRALGAGDVARTWPDLRAAARLSALVAQTPLSWEWLAGAATMRPVVDEALGAFATHATLTPTQARALLSELERLPDPPSVGDTIDRVGRVDALAGVTVVILDNDQDGWKTLEVPSAVAEHADWNAVLRAINRWFDRLAAAARIGDPVPRRRAVAAWMADFEAAQTRAPAVLQTAGRDPSAASRARAAETSEALAVKIGQMDSAARWVAVEDFDTAARGLDVVALALAAYRADKGAFPASLAALVPGYLTAIPRDPYDPGAFTYEPRDSGYLLYSRGPDGRADKAAGAKSGDDLVLRVP
jgi:hypothetical protein